MFFILDVDKKETGMLEENYFGFEGNGQLSFHKSSLRCQEEVQWISYR
jgi:hypothetical protein